MTSTSSTSSYDYWWPYPPQVVAPATTATPTTTHILHPTTTDTTDNADDDDASTLTYSIPTQTTISSISTTIPPSLSSAYASSFNSDSVSNTDTDSASNASDSLSISPTDTASPSASSTSSTAVPQADLSKISLPLPLVYILPVILLLALLAGFGIGWCLARRRRPSRSSGPDAEALLPSPYSYDPYDDSAPPTPCEKAHTRSRDASRDPFLLPSQPAGQPKPTPKLLKHGQRYSISLAPALANSPPSPPSATLGYEHRRTPSLFSPYSVASASRFQGDDSPLPGSPSKGRHNRTRSTRTAGTRSSATASPRTARDSPRPSWFRRAVANAVSPRSQGDRRIPSGLTARLRRSPDNPDSPAEAEGSRERISRLLLARREGGMSLSSIPPQPPPKSSRDLVLPMSPPQVTSPVLFMGEDYASPSVYSLASPPPVGLGLGRSRTLRNDLPEVAEDLLVPEPAQTANGGGGIGLGRPAASRGESVRGGRTRPLEVRKKRPPPAATGLGVPQPGKGRGRKTRESMGLGIQQRLEEEELEG